MKEKDELEKLEEELSIDTTSLFSLEKELTDFPKKVARVHRWYAETCKEVNKLELKLELLSSILVEEIKNNSDKSIPPSAWGEIRRSQVPLDKKYKELKDKWIKTSEIQGILKGLVKGWEGKGYRLAELVQLSERTMFNEPKVYRKNSSVDADQFSEEKMDKAGENLEY